ncbi:SpsF Spore coat polysaccharide biosynthesis protein F, CMP-KDO synthetase homolog [Candidatus Nanopelagicaceae bacterium]
MSGNLLVVQARTSSTRFPGKVLEDLDGQPMIRYQIERLRKSTLVDKIVVATSTEASDNPLSEYLHSINQPVIRGPLEDVLARFFLVLDTYEPRYFVRITGDCPLVMPDLLDSMIQEFESSEIDYLSNVLEPSYPDGLDIEIINTSALRQLNSFDLTSTEREHVTLGIYSRPSQFKLKNFNSNFAMQEERWTVDYPEDLEFIRRIVRFESTQPELLTFSQVLNFLEDHPEQRNTLSGSLRNEALKDWEPQHE